MKIAIETVQEEAEQLLAPDQAKALIKAITDAAQLEAEADKASREPTVKKQLVIVLSDPLGIISDRDLDEFVGWILQIPEDDDAGTALDRVIRSAYAFNVSKKGRRHPAKSIGEACEAVGARFLKEQNVAVKTKLPVRVIVTNNKLPEMESDFKGGKWA